MQASHYIIVLFLALAVCVSPVQAANDPKGLVLEISGVFVVEDTRFSPCYPLDAFFTHPDPRVTTIRMENPRNPRQYIDYPKNTAVNIHIHENFMKQGEYSWSNFIAMDNAGNEYGRMHVIFDPPADPHHNTCNEHFNS